MQSFEQHLSLLDVRRAEDAERFKNLDDDLCQVCWAYGADKRSLFVSCFYDVKEVVPEFIDLHSCEGMEDRKNFYYLRICKTCRARFLMALKEWFDGRVQARDLPKDHDGYVESDNPERRIPYRINGATVLLTADEYTEIKARRSE